MGPAYTNIFKNPRVSLHMVSLYNTSWGLLFTQEFLFTMGSFTPTFSKIEASRCTWLLFTAHLGACSLHILGASLYKGASAIN